MKPIEYQQIEGEFKVNESLSLDFATDFGIVTLPHWPFEVVASGQSVQLQTDENGVYEVHEVNLTSFKFLPKEGNIDSVYAIIDIFK